MVSKIGFGGSCHWCTEAIFLSLKGVKKVDQGWIASDGEYESFNEAVIVEFDTKVISLHELIAVHLYTHSCTVNHSMRGKYRSAIYTFREGQEQVAQSAVSDLQPEFQKPIITKVIPYKRFRINKDDYLNYYYSDPAKPFCRNIINPKLKILLNRFSKNVDPEKLKHLQK